ncbi:MAG: hypothetical protein O7A67_05700, partial [SAR324 cluster bacterium]|nr:hypothetical protein [SAR324 cluster bacterium]
GVPANVIGVSPGVPGPFNRHGTAVSGTIAEYQNDGNGAVLGFILAHEFGHFLGLFHTSQTSGDRLTIIGEYPIADTELCQTSDLGGIGHIENCPDRTNLMFPYVLNDTDPPITTGQGNVVKFNPGITVP